MNLRRPAACIASLLATLSLAHDASGQCQYEFFPYYGPSRISQSLTLTSVSETGWLGGSIDTLYGTPIVISPDGVLTVLPGSATSGSGVVKAVNNDGVPVGSVPLDPGSVDAKPVWWANGTLTPLPSPVPFTHGDARAINESGFIAGSIYGIDGPGAGAIWHDGVLVYYLESLTSLSGISEDGTVVGKGRPTPRSLLRAFRWHDGVIEWLPLPEGMTTSSPNDISSSGLVVGLVMAGIYAPPQATLWTESGPTILPMPAGYANSYADGVNALGQVIGRCTTEYSGALPELRMLWQNGSGVPIFSLLTSPFSGSNLILRDINDRGEIAGRGVDAYGNTCGMVLRPVRTRVGDVTIDCHVDERDLIALLEFWGERYTYDGGPGDLDGDGEVGSFDLAVLLGDWDT